MRQVAGYLISYPDARAIMAKLQIPDKEVDDIMLEHPLNDWLARKKRYNIVCATVGHIYSSYKDAEGVFLITHIRDVRRRKSRNGETLAERDKDKYVKTWLVQEGGADGDSLRWISFPDADEHLLISGVRPERNNFHGRWVDYDLTHDQVLRSMRAKMTMVKWAMEAEARGEAVKRIWPPREDSSHP